MGEEGGENTAVRGAGCGGGGRGIYCREGGRVWGFREGVKLNLNLRSHSIIFLLNAFFSIKYHFQRSFICIESSIERTDTFYSLRVQIHGVKTPYCSKALRQLM